MNYLIWMLLRAEHEPALLELEREEVAASLEGVRVMLVAFEEGPFMIAYDVSQLGRAEG